MMDEEYMRVKQVADKIGMSEDWVRRFFGEIEGVRKVKSPDETLQTPLYNSSDSCGIGRAGAKKDVRLSAERRTRGESFQCAPVDLPSPQ